MKDANEFLVKYGPNALREYLDTAQPVPVPGLLRMGGIADPPAIETWHPGFKEWGERIRIGRSMVSVVTGQPGHGKTSLFAQIFYNVLRTYNLVGVFGSFETRPKPHYQRMLRQFYHLRTEWKLTDAEKADADEWIQSHTLWLLHPEQQPDLGWVLDAAATAVYRHKAAILQIDPWNRLIPDRGRFERETDWVSRSLDRCLDFAKGMNVHVQIIAHPSKGDFASRKHPPSLEDISGSKHWDNKADQGFVIWRPALFKGTERWTEAELFHLKARYQELGYPCRLPIRYDYETGAFTACCDEEPTPEPSED